MQLTKPHKYNWYFLQPTLSGTAGVIIGLVIAYGLGWV